MYDEDYDPDKPIVNIYWDMAMRLANDVVEHINNRNISEIGNMVAKVRVTSDEYRSILITLNNVDVCSICYETKSNFSKNKRVVTEFTNLDDVIKNIVKVCNNHHYIFKY